MKSSVCFKMRSIEKIIAAAALLAAVSLSAETINPNDYANSVKIRFDGYTGTSALTNFPALIELRDNVNGFHFSDMESDDYSDLRFTKDDGITVIPFEVEQWKALIPPSKIDGCMLWLKADAGITTNTAGGVTAWVDQSPEGNDAWSATATIRPTVITNAINGLPVVRFNGASDNFIAFPKMTNIRTVFWVIKEDPDATYTPNPRFLLGDYSNSPQTYHFHRGGNKEIWSSAHAPLMFNGITELNGNVIDGRTTLMPNTMSVLSVRTSGNATANSLSYDRTIPGRTWDGDVAELIIYNRVLTEDEVDTVYTYLENKYAIDISTAPLTDGAHCSSIWVQVPELTNNASICAYWGNAGATGIPVYTTNGVTWSENFGGVWHMDSPNPVDSTTNANHGVAGNSPLATPALAGDGVITTSSTQDDIRIDDADSIDPATNFTASIWFRSKLGGAWYRNLMGNYGASGGSGNFWGLGWMNANNLGFVVRTGGSETRLYGSAANDGKWHLLTGQKEGDAIRLYIDGEFVASGTRAGSPANTEQLRFCSHGTTYVDAIIDEARICNAVRSPDWIKATYDNQSDPAAFAAVILDYHYDTSTSAGLQTGSGEWSTSTNFWSKSTAGDDPLRVWENGARAYFEASGTSAVTVESITAQKITFNGTGYTLSGGTVAIDRGGIEANESAGIGSSVSLLDDQAWNVASGKTLSSSGVISGIGALTKDGNGTLTLDAYNTYSGDTTINEGILQLNKGGGSATVRGVVTVESGGQLDLLNNHVLGLTAGQKVTAININGGLVNNIADGDNGNGVSFNLTGGEMRSNGGVSSTTSGQKYTLSQNTKINSLPADETSLVSGHLRLWGGNTETDNLGAFIVADGPPEIDLLVSAGISLEPDQGSGILKSGYGTMSLTADSTYTGTTRIDAGTLLVNNATGSGTGFSAVQLNGGTLGGTGTVAGAVSVGANGGIIAPGSSVGTLTIEGGLDMTTGYTSGIFFELESASAYDSLAVTGGVTLGGCLLSGTVGSSVTPGDKFFIIVNQGMEAVSGTFDGIPQGGTVEIDGFTFTVSYQGDSASGTVTGGNDVVLYNAVDNSVQSAPYWKQISFGGYNRPTVLTNFPASVPLFEELEDFSYSTFLSDTGDDLRFYSDTNKTAELHYEIETWDTNGTSYVWVKIPELTTNTTIWAYWGDAAQSTPPSYTGDGSTWSSGFAGVWHLSDSTGVIEDSSALGLDGSNISTTSKAGVIGNARYFPASSRIAMNAGSLASVSSEVSISFWQWCENNGNVIFSATKAGNRILQSHLPWSNWNVYWDAGLTGTSYDRINAVGPSTYFQGGWSHWVFTKNTGDGTMRVYRNGVQWFMGTGKTRSMAGADSFTIGAASNGTLQYLGSIDEFRVSNVERSPDWIWACYINQKDPVAFTSPRAAAYWDTSDALGLQSGDGTWDSASTSLWSDDGTFGSSPLLNWNSAQAIAHFNAFGGGTVTVAGNVEARAVVIDEPGYTLTGGSLILTAGITANESATIRTPVTAADIQDWDIAAGKTLTLDGPGWNIASSLTKRGGGILKIINQNYSFGGAELDFVVQEGELQFGTSYWGTSKPSEDLRIHVMPDAAFRVTQRTALGTNGPDNPGSLRQLILEENATWHISTDYGAINGATYGGAGSLVMRGASVLGGRIIPGYGMAIDTKASAVTSRITSELNGYSSGTWYFNVEDGAASTDLRQEGVINGNVASIVKNGPGCMEVIQANYHNGSTVNAGTLLVNNTSGSGTGDAGAVTINGGSVAGTGYIAQAVGFGAGGGSIAPGNSTGILTVNNNVVFTSNAALKITIDDAFDYSSLAVNGAVDLAGATLDVTLNSDLSGINHFVIIENDGTDAVTGTFSGIPEGSSVKVGDNSFRVYYSADADSGEPSGGNDVMLISNSRGTLIIIK